ncbi:hypothetical protein Q8F55_002491 [Vanrija albida]|uniref:Uncharacterized protein n=1 Tax=Vanrija albida TaxID=181172 RepID=A0ABR3QA40_9TREE
MAPKGKHYEPDEDDFPEVKVKQSESMTVVAEIIKHVKAQPAAFTRGLVPDASATKDAKLDEILIDLANKFDLSADLVRPGEAHRREKRRDEWWMEEARASLEVRKRKPSGQADGGARKVAKEDTLSPDSAA